MIIPFAAGGPTDVMARLLATIQELVERLRREPGKYAYGWSGNGGMIHLASYLFATKVGADAVHVPYRGSGHGRYAGRPPRFPDGHAGHQRGLY
jgi:tripartite-type tricarboxylate transporter receptor subunit TctC